jgi:polysaccharide export outer membrane protein
MMIRGNEDTNRGGDATGGFVRSIARRNHVLKLCSSAVFAALILVSRVLLAAPVDPAFNVVEGLAASSEKPAYRIGPSDLLSVKIFQVADLDRQVRVNNAGDISLPLVGAVHATGRTVEELEGDLQQRYASRYLQNPQVTVFVEEFASQRITVGGSVKKPGIFPITSGLSLLQAVALAEGVTETASLRNVLVFRDDAGQHQFARFDLRQIAEGAQPDPQLKGGDVIVVDASTGKLALQNLIKLAPFVAVWRAYR